MKSAYRSAPGFWASERTGLLRKFPVRCGDSGAIDCSLQTEMGSLAGSPRLLYSASISGRVATGPRAGRRLAKVGDAIDLEDLAVASGPHCAAVASVLFGNVQTEIGS